MSLSIQPHPSVSAANSAGSAERHRTTTANFADALKTSQSHQNAFNGGSTLPSRILSGRLGLELNSAGIPARMLYFDQGGGLLTTSTFNAESILRMTEKFDIKLSDLQGIGSALDDSGIGFRPYDLYPGTGSDHGIDFDDLIAGGLGTAYDWTRDRNIHQKGALAAQRLEASLAFATRRGLQPNPAVTTGGGLDPGRFEPLAARGEPLRTHIMYNGTVAAWHHGAEAATRSAQHYGGTHIQLSAGTATPRQASQPSTRQEEWSEPERSTNASLATPVPDQPVPARPEASDTGRLRILLELLLREAKAQTLGR